MLMRYQAHSRWVFGVLGMCVAGLAATGYAPCAPDPMDILTKAMTQYETVKDYTAHVIVDANIPDVDIPKRKVKVYVKPPDKVYVQSRGIVFIPKRALLFGDIAKDLKKEAKAVLVGTKTSNGKTTYCVKLMPKRQVGHAQDEQPRVLIWIDGGRWTLQKVQVSARGETVMSVTFTHKQTQGFWMPAKVTARFTGKIISSDKPASMTITYSDYKINTGLTDEFFESKTGNTRRERRRARRQR